MSLRGGRERSPIRPPGSSPLSTVDGSPDVSPENHRNNSSKRVFFDWVGMIFGRHRRTRQTSDPGAELQIMLPNSGEVCLLAESPFRILRAAESGNVEDFMRLYLSEPSRLAVRDGRGRTAAHQAAARNNINILQFIKNYGGDLNVSDNIGNTPLHVAVENEALQSVEFLLQQRVDSGILNERTQAPIHLATELNKVSVLEVFVKYKNLIDVNQGGEHGRTALHFAAIHDHEKCAKILITDLEAQWKRPCNNGYYPIHEAAKNASSRTIEVFLQWGESKGCTRESMISLYDNEGNVPLHSAVHGGDIKAVELCLKSGAKISTQQHDLSTPVHLACAQGALEMVKLMFTMQPKEKMACLTSCDVQRMTPIHCAAIFDHPDIVKYLIAEGSDINPLDKEGRSPLLLAASRAGWKTVHALILLGADIQLKDINLRNILHLVVINGGNLADFATSCKNRCEKSLNQLLNEKDSTGCSPLHYASREGHIRSLENLIHLGACVNLKNNNNESPLHFAARYGRINTVCRLLDSDKGTFIINESDGEGLTPLHIASREGHARLVQILLNRGALLHRDHNGRNPLHLAAMSGYTQTIDLLHSVHSHLLDQTDKDGNTPLHLATMENKPNSIALLLSKGCALSYNNMDMSAIDYAIYYKFPEAALAMVTHEQRAYEVMALRSDRHPCVTLALIAYMPRVFEAVQDKCISKANCKKDSKSFYIKYNFDVLCPRLRDEDATIAEKTPLPALNAMVAHGRVELLAHSVSQKYLQMKWNSYGKYFHLANLLFYSIYLFLLTFYTLLLMKGSKAIEMRQSCNGTAFNNTKVYNDKATNVKRSEDAFQDHIIMAVCAYCILVYNGLFVLREIYSIKEQKWHYFVDPSNFVYWILYSSTTMTVLPTVTGYFSDTQLSAAAISIFISWFNLLLLLQRFDQVGIYVVMFLEILQTLMKVLMVFSILIIAFGLAFYILLSKVGSLSVFAAFIHISVINIVNLTRLKLKMLESFCCLKVYCK